MTNKQISTFNNFLIVNGAFVLFRSGIQCHGFQIREDMAYKKKVIAIMAVRYAFPWDKVFEPSFWEKLNDKWEDVCIKKGYLDGGFQEEGLKQAIGNVFGDRQIITSSDNVFDDNENKNDMEDFTFYDFTYKNRCSSIGENKFALNNTEKTCCLTFNVETSAEIIKNGLLFLRLRVDNITGDMHLVFTKDTGLKLQLSGSSTRKNVLAKNKSLVAMLSERLGISKQSGRYLVGISGNMANSTEYLTYKILQEECSLE